MAYVSQEDKKKLAPAIKAVLKKYGMKGTIAVKHHSTLVVNIKSGELDLIGACNLGTLKNFGSTNSAQWMHTENEQKRVKQMLNSEHHSVNPYWIDKHYVGDKVISFLNELKDAMEGPEFFNEDDPMTDYFHRSHYIDINVGDWNKPYVCTGPKIKIDADKTVEKLVAIYGRAAQELAKRHEARAVH